MHIRSKGYYWGKYKRQFYLRECKRKVAYWPMRLKQLYKFTVYLSTSPFFYHFALWQPYERNMQSHCSIAKSNREILHIFISAHGLNTYISTQNMKKNIGLLSNKVGGHLSKFLSRQLLINAEDQSACNITTLTNELPIIWFILYFKVKKNKFIWLLFSY